MRTQLIRREGWLSHAKGPAHSRNHESVAEFGNFPSLTGQPTRTRVVSPRIVRKIIKLKTL